jgi:hypothetical protein
MDPTAGFGLDPHFAATLGQLLATCRAAGYDFRVANGLRTPQVQAEYYCKWRGHSPAMMDAQAKRLSDKKAPWLAALLLHYRDISRSNAKLTDQLPGSGWHQWGLAADAYCYRNGTMVEDGDDPCYKASAEEATRLGLTAGFYFRCKDSGHVQAPSADGASDVYTWSYIDDTMKQRFGGADIGNAHGLVDRSRLHSRDRRSSRASGVAPRRIGRGLRRHRHQPDLCV